jgi:hypothetical protein
MKTVQKHTLSVLVEKYGGRSFPGLPAVFPQGV